MLNMACKIRKKAQKEAVAEMSHQQECFGTIFSGIFFPAAAGHIQPVFNLSLRKFSKVIFLSERVSSHLHNFFPKYLERNTLLEILPLHSGNILEILALYKNHAMYAENIFCLFWAMNKHNILTILHVCIICVSMCVWWDIWAGLYFSITFHLCVHWKA